MSTTDGQASRLVAFLQAKEKPMFKGLKSDSIACNRVCLGRVSSLVAASGLPLRLLVMFLNWGAASNVAKELQSSICYHYESGRQLTMSQTSEMDNATRWATKTKLM